MIVSMLVYCNARDCRWNTNGRCEGAKQPAGHTAIYIERTQSGKPGCSDYAERENEDDGK